mmetsp:Transcript_37840/g.100089  ORF Transcript_37840/g.100089 Transcript_37840/m.100089 type:complete len:98 (-) Transcript_37840:157-450(-)
MQKMLIPTISEHLQHRCHRAVMGGSSSSQHSIAKDRCSSRVSSWLALAADFECVLDPGGYGYLLRALCTPRAFVLHASVAERDAEARTVLLVCSIRV